LINRVMANLPHDINELCHRTALHFSICAKNSTCLSRSATLVA
jgi:hypothetical protein